MMGADVKKQNEQTAAAAGPEVEGPVRARWVSVQTVLVPGRGLVRYGDEIWVSAEQLASADHPTIVWSDDWVVDEQLAAQARAEG
jgi:hypothetical protein